MAHQVRRPGEASRLRSGLAVVLALALFAASCGDDDSTTGSDEATQTDGTTDGASDEGADGTTDGSGDSADGTADSTDGSDETVPEVFRDGTIKVGLSLTNFSTDPSFPGSPTMQWMTQLVTGTLLKMNGDGTIVPELAESAVVVDSSTIEVTLRSGLTYHDGTAFTAQAVKDGIERNLQSDLAGTAYAMAELANMEEIDVTGDTTFTIHLSSPVAGSFYPLLTRAEFATLSPTSYAPDVFPAESAYGAGPYKFVSLDDEQLLVLERWDDWFGAEDINIKTVEVVHVEAEGAINALRDNAVDYMLTTYSTAQQVGDAMAIDYVTNPENTGTIFMNCKKHPGWDNELVRQAVNLAIDREAISNVVFGGQAEVLDTMLGSASGFYDPELAGANTRDVDRAKELLSEAGFAEGIDLGELYHGTDIAGTQHGELIQSQLAEAGITVRLVATGPSFVSDFYIQGITPAAITTAVTWSGIDRLLVNYPTGGIGNTCDVGEEGPNGETPDAAEMRMQEVLIELRALDPTSDEALELWAEAQGLVSEHAWQIWLTSPPIARAYDSDKVGNPSEIPMWAGNAPDIRTMTVLPS
jgi:peptide/nickel transport system substrate-binding protein